MLSWRLSTQIQSYIGICLHITNRIFSQGWASKALLSEAPALAACLGGKRHLGLGLLLHPKVQAPVPRGAWHRYFPALLYQSCSALYRITWARGKEKYCKHACIGEWVGHYICTQYLNPAATSGRSDGNALRTP